MSEVPLCPSCERGKFNRPRIRCKDLDFHWLLAGREWKKDDDGLWRAVETEQSRRESFDGLLAPKETPTTTDEVIF